MRFTVCFACALLMLSSMNWSHSAEPPQPDPDLPDGTEAALKQLATFRVPDGLKVALFAAEPRLASPVAITLDERNRVFVAEEFRFNRGTEEDRTRPFLLEDDLQLRTTDDRLAMFRKFADKFDGGMSWFTKTSDQIRLLEDADGDGRADRSQVFATGFNEPLDGLAAGVLARDGDLYFTCIPHLWRLRDTNGDGIADTREKLLSGFGVNAAFLGHDLHGLVWGPDGKLYFSVGDRGFHVTSRERVIFHGPRTGAVFRCNPDGSEFEVVHRGLRNPQEIAFDQWGNLFAADNNCDKGDHSRLVQIVEGADSGWNMAFQSLPAPYLTGPWHAEKMWSALGDSASADQPAWLLPAVGPLGAGPSGFAYYPGVGLPTRYADHFFMCNYTGNGGVESFAVKPRGASFEIIDAHDFFKPINATDVEFGYDGTMYVSDFVNLDWSGKSKGGRLFTLSEKTSTHSEALARTRELLREPLTRRGTDELLRVLWHPDMRLRLRAQFELVARGDVAVEPLDLLAADRAIPTVTRLHAIWGLGQIGKKQPQVLSRLFARLADDDETIRCQTIKLLGESRVAEIVPDLLRLVNQGTHRDRFFAALALGRIAAAEPTTPLGARRGDTVFPANTAVVPVIRSPEEQARVKRGLVNLAVLEMLRANDDADPYLRHAGVMALAWIGDLELVQSFARDRSPAVRRAVLLVQRRLADPRIEQFLNDDDWTIVTEAARAIHDVPLEASQAALARTLDRLNVSSVLAKPLAPRNDSPTEQVLTNSPPRVIDLEPLLRRALAANFRQGDAESLRRVIAVAMNTSHSLRVRDEAFALLAAWADPPPRDRVTGFWRPLAPRDAATVRIVLNEQLPQLLAAANGSLITPVVDLVARHGLTADEATFANWLRDLQRPAAARIAALKLLAARNSTRLPELLNESLTSNAPALRAAARTIAASRNPVEGLAMLRQVLANPPSETSSDSHVIDQQQAILTLSEMKHREADDLLTKWAERLANGDVPAELQVDVLEAATTRREVPAINLALQRRSARLSTLSQDPLAAHRLALLGGDADAGRALFVGHPQGQCVRCHKVAGHGGTAGPDLSDVAKRNPEQTREHLLQALIDPNAKIAPGFGSVTLVLTNGRVVAGILKSENAESVHIETPEGQALTVAVKDIDERSPPKSTMPPMNKVLSPRELRDLIAFLATLRGTTPEPSEIPTASPPSKPK